MTTAPVGDPGPAGLFLDYYAQASAWTASERATAISPDLAFDDLARKFLSDEDDGGLARMRLLDLVEGKSCDPAAHRGRVLGALSAIDRAFFQIHPRALIGITARRLPEWLREARFLRSATGEYARVGTRRLIARGPLLRDARHLYASSGDLLSDYFSALAVAPAGIVHDGRIITIRVKVIGHDALTGVPLAANVGAETVGFLPLARDKRDILALPVTRAGRKFAAYAPAPHFDAGAAALAGLRALGDVDIAVMPELALGEAHVDGLAARLMAETAPLARMIVAGSYSTLTLNADGQPWNECRILNRRGVELWRQRKLWPAGVGPGPATRYGLPAPGTGGLLLEDNAAGEEIVVADVDGLGRCVVLICQDCEMPVLVPELFSSYQPDWVFTPIFDCTIDPGRWAHARAFGLSQLSQARCIAVTNMAFAAVGANMGLAVGPKEPASDHLAEIERAIAIVTKPGPSKPLVGKLTWRSGDWDQSWLDTRPASASR